MPPPSRAPKLLNAKQSGPGSHQQQQAGQLRDAKQVRALVQGRCLESLVLERLQLPEQVVEFIRFEELSRAYEIEQPFVARTQIELLFDVYDGKRLHQGLFESLDDGDEDLENVVSSAHSGAQGGVANNLRAGTTSGSSSSPSSASRRRSSFAASKAGGVAASKPKGGGGLSWCKSLFARRCGPSAATTSGTSTNQQSKSPFKCCLKPSDTNHELGLLSVSTSSGGLSAEAPAGATPPTNPLLGVAQAALDDLDGTQQGAEELKREAVRVLGSALACSTGHPVVDLAGGGGPGSSLGPALAMESAQMESTGGSVSVCLLDKRLLGGARNRKHLATTTSHGDRAASSARWLTAGANSRRAAHRNGRQWARASARLVQVRRKLRNSGAKSLLQMLESQKVPQAKVQLGRHLDRIARKVSRRFWSELAHDHLLDSTTGERSTNEENLDPDQVEQLIELVKGSLNQLIDAQLLLKNKLTGQDQLSSSALVTQVRSAEYENLLRNNFNLLKIWQNLEETQASGLVCFVCEPIRANLGDLFAFNRQRLEWAPAVAFESAHLNSNTTPSAGSSQAAAGRNLHFMSPLVCLDGVQVKRGLLQILEALNFLHGGCKLIHRNVTPTNILVCQNDNWKLSGLEFAVRFESTTISESASMMAHEFGQIRFALSSTTGPSSSHGAGGSSTCNGALGGGAGGGGVGGGHETKCQEFSRRAKCALLQPELDYLAPEILRNSRCSHKSDLFSFGLLLGQTYDLCNHKAPISCRGQAANYERQLKKLEERRKAKLVHSVPFEMRLVLNEMLDSEPNLRPSANHALQLLKRPVELCQSSEDSLRHLKSSLDYLDTRLAAGQTGGAHNQQQLEQQFNADQLQQQQQAGQTAANKKNRRKTTSYFKRVTSAAASREPGRRQTKSLQLLNYFVRAVDAMAGLGLQPSPSQQRGSPSQTGDFLQDHQNRFGTALGSALGAQQNQRRLSFCSQRVAFEQTLEILRQVLKSSSVQANEPPAEFASGSHELPPTSGDNSCPADARSLLLLVALHRRLLEQVGQLRAELPPICRLMGPTSGGANQPLDRNLASANHRALADLEERLYLVVSQQSIARLSEALADPLLKLDEFLLVFELVNDLIGFVGQKCKQNYSQRGRQLLHELTPVTGCPSLSSSEDEDEEDEQRQQQHEQLAGGLAQQQRAFGGSTLALGMQGNSQATTTNQVKRLSQQDRLPYSSQANQFGEASTTNSSGDFQQMSQAGAKSLSRPPSRQQLYNLPTSINITAPSPMGSVRDVNRLGQAGGGEFAFASGGRGSPSGASSPMKRHSHQDILANIHQQQQQHNALIDKTSQMTLGGGSASPSRRSIANCLPGAGAGGELESASGEPKPQDDKSRSELIDELLKTINDDSFNEFIDFNNKLSAAAGTSSQPDQMNAEQLGGGLSSAADLANAGRPKSAIGGHQSSSATTAQQSRRQSTCSPGAGRAAPPPRTLNLAGVAGAGSHQQQQATGRYQARGSVCVGAGAQTSTFDNVIRRMSTNFVQNFNKMSAGTLGGGVSANQTNENNTQQQHQLGYPELSVQHAAGMSNSSTQLRREKSSTSTYSNSLYVDNQVPARRHSDNTINVPRIQVALSSPGGSTGSRTNLNQRASVSASKLANKWKLTAKSNQREASDKLSPNLGGALGYIRRHSSGNTQGGGGNQNANSNQNQNSHSNSNSNNDQNQSNGGLGAHLLNAASPFKTRSSSNLGIDFLMSNRSMKRRYSAASMLGHQTQRKAEDLIDAGMKSVQNMFS